MSIVAPTCLLANDWSAYLSTELTKTAFVSAIHASGVWKAAHLDARSLGGTMAKR